MSLLHCAQKYSLLNDNGTCVLFQSKELNDKAKVEWKEMEERHSLVQSKVGNSSVLSAGKLVRVISQEKTKKVYSKTSKNLTLIYTFTLRSLEVVGNIL